MTSWNVIRSIPLPLAPVFLLIRLPEPRCFEVLQAIGICRVPTLIFVTPTTSFYEFEHRR
jgi:hypothetical protein